jgi:HrpA-like RNA helicase
MEQVQNAIDFLTMIGALDERENLTNLGESVFLSYSVGCL